MIIHRSTALGGAIHFHVAHDADDKELCASFPNTETGKWAAADWQTRLAHRGDVTLFDDDIGQCVIGTMGELLP